LISHNRPCFGSEEEAAAVGVLRSGWVAQGEQVAAFEDEVCAFLDLPPGYGVAVSSGSAALYVALLALGASGQKVIAPAYSCRAISNAIELARATPLWGDIGVDRPNLDPEAINSDIAPIAILAHMFGMPAALPEGNSPVVIEDCAQALGAELSGRKVGTIGKIGVFSFAATKLMTTGGQGGMLVSRDSAIVEFVRKARDYDTVPDGHPRFNIQMTDVQAAIGRVQIRKLPGFLTRRRQIFERYVGAGINLLDTADLRSVPVRFRAVMRTDQPLQWRKRLAEAEIRAIVPVTQGEILTDYLSVPRAAEFSRRTLSLPIHPALTDSDVDHIVDTLLSSPR
jgi:perosamine synthetase